MSGNKKKADPTRLKAKPHAQSSIHVACPFCGFAVHPGNPFKWCAGCYVEYEEDDRGNVWFDKKLKRPEYLWAIALAKVGGARIGSPDLFKNLEEAEEKGGTQDGEKTK